MINRCRELWDEVDKKFDGTLNLMMTDSMGDLLTKIKEESCKDDVWDEDLHKRAQENWNKLKAKLEKINNLNQIEIQLSAAQQSWSILYLSLD